MACLWEKPSDISLETILSDHWNLLCGKGFGMEGIGGGTEAYYLSKNYRPVCITRNQYSDT